MVSNLTSLLVAVPVGVVLLLRCYRKQLPEMQEKMGNLYLGIDTKRKTAMAYSPLFFGRRFVYAAVAACAGTFDGGLTLVLVVAISQSFCLYLVAVKPNKSSAANKFELVCEMLLLSCFV